MSASIDDGIDHGWIASYSAADLAESQDPEWDELPTDGSHAWLGMVLLLGSAIVTIRGICWLVATAIRLAH